MKKFVSILAAVIIAMLAIVPATMACAESTAAGQLYVVADNGKTLNLRAAPEAKGTVLAHLGVGYPLTKIGVVNGDWMKVSAKVDGHVVTGYVKRSFVSTNDPALRAQSFRKVSPFYVTVRPTSGSAGYVNLRSQANTGSAVVSYLYKGEALTVIAESNAYYHVRTADGMEGYVVKAYVIK